MLWLFNFNLHRKCKILKIVELYKHFKLEYFTFFQFVESYLSWNFSSYWFINYYWFIYINNDLIIISSSINQIYISSEGVHILNLFSPNYKVSINSNISMNSMLRKYVAWILKLSFASSKFLVSLLNDHDFYFYRYYYFFDWVGQEQPNLISLLLKWINPLVNLIRNYSIFESKNNSCSKHHKVNDPQNMRKYAKFLNLFACLIIFKFIQSLWSRLLVLYQFCTKKNSQNSLQSSQESKIFTH